MALMKICSRCGKKISYDSTCECMDKSKKDRYKEYKKLRQDKDRQKFYSSCTWIRLRDMIYRKFYGLCIPCLFKGAIVNATTVHHIVPTEDNSGRWLDEGNLVVVCQSYHMRIHNQYKDSKSKNAMQEVLFGLLKKFEKEYR